MKYVLLSYVFAGFIIPSPWEVTLRPGRPAGVSDVAEDPSLTVIVRNLAGPDPAVMVRFQVSDYEGILLRSGSAAAVVPQGESRAIDVRLGDAARLPHGEYLPLHLTILADGK